MQRPHISRNLATRIKTDESMITNLLQHGVILHVCSLYSNSIVTVCHLMRKFDEKRNWRPYEFLKYYYFLQTEKFIFILPAKPKIEGKRAYLKRHMKLLLNSLSKSLTNLLMVNMTSE